MSDEGFEISAQTRESLVTRYSSLVTFSGATFMLRENTIALKEVMSQEVMGLLVTRRVVEYI